MNKLKTLDKPLHRSWLRWLPYSAFGALLISWQWSSNWHSLASIYGLLMSSQIVLVVGYLLWKNSQKNQQDRM
ncbi:MAG: hypothetical protein Tsb0014_17660 [Pleurocapsa sp.]